MTVSAAELLGGYNIARRDLPWRSPGVTAWQILVSEFMLQQTLVARVQPSGSTGWRVGPLAGGGRRAAGLGQAGLTLECSVAIHRLALMQPFQRRAHRRRPQLLQILDRSGALTVDTQTSN